MIVMKMLKNKKIFLFCSLSLLHHVAMGLVCLHPMTPSSQARLRQLHRIRGIDERGGVSLQLCTCMTTYTCTPVDSAAVATRSSYVYWPTAAQNVLAKLQGAAQTTPWWIVVTPQFFDRFYRFKPFYHFQKNETTLPVVVPYGSRWAIANQVTDLSGTWIPIVTAEFQRAFDSFLLNCGQPYFRRKLMVQFLGLTKEVIQQKSRGQELEIISANPLGQWNRTLVASGTTTIMIDERNINTTTTPSPPTTTTMTTVSTTSTMAQYVFQPIHHSIQDPEGDTVQIEAWWENDGTIHRSWLRGSNKVNGIFEARRYLESQNVLVCESFFHPSSPPSSSSTSRVVWRYSRAGH